MSTKPSNGADPQQFAAGLAQIHAARLYRSIGYATFGEYVEQHCGIARDAAYRLLREEAA